jgi:hypothetical protein
MPLRRNSIRTVVLLAMIGLSIVACRRNDVEDARRLSDALKQDSRFTSVNVYNTETGHIVMVVAPGDFPTPDRPALDDLVKHYTDRRVIYGMSSIPHASP